MSGVLLDFLVRNGPMLLTGVTALLLAGCLLASACRSPLHRQRVCELSVLAALAWAIAASLPLPRLEPRQVAANPSRTNQLTLSDIPPELIAGSASAAPRTSPASAAQPPAQPAAPSRPIDWPRLATVTLLAASIGCCAWLALGHLLLWRTIRRARRVPDNVTRTLDPRIRVLTTAKVAGPMTCGIFRPTILLPPALLESENEIRLRQVLLHEVAHVEQRDAVGNALFCLALPLLYFHPLYWWLRRSAELARELVADECAARADGKAAYAAELVALAADRTRTVLPRLAVAGIGIFQRPSHFYRRMRMLLQRTHPLPTRCSPSWRAALAIATLAAVAVPNVFLGVRPARAQDKPATAAAADPNQPDPAAAAQFDPANPPADRPLTAAEKQQVYLYGQLVAKKQEETRAADAASAINELTVAQVGMIDPNMKKLLDERAQLHSEIARLKQVAGVNHPQFKEAEVRLEDLNDRISKYAADWKAFQLKPAAPRQPGGRGAGAFGAPALPQQPGQPTGGALIGGVQLDLINLANSVVDAGGALRSARVKIERSKQLMQTGGANALEVAAAEADLLTAQKRVELLRSIAEVALQSAQADLDRTKKLSDQGLVSAQELDGLTSKVKMLELIVRGAN